MISIFFNCLLLNYTLFNIINPFFSWPYLLNSIVIFVLILLILLTHPISSIILKHIDITIQCYKNAALHTAKSTFEEDALAPEIKFSQNILKSLDGCKLASNCTITLSRKQKLLVEATKCTCLWIVFSQERR